MTFKEFKGITYHTRLSIRIPGSKSVIDKSQLFSKGKYDGNKEDTFLKQVYEQEEFVNR